VLVDYEAHVCM